MAVVSAPYSAALVLVYQTGVSTSGAPITRQRTIQNIVYNASEQAIYDAAHDIFSLSEYTLLDVYFRRTDEITDDEE